MAARRDAVGAVALGIVLLASAIAGRADVGAKLEDVSVTVEGTYTIVRLKTSAPRRYRAELVEAPDRLILEFENTLYAWRRTPMVTAAGPVMQIRGSQYRDGVVRVVFDLRAPVPYWVNDEGDSVVVVLGAPRAAAPAASPATAAPAPAERDPAELPRRPTAVAQTTPASPPAAAPPMPTPPSPPPAAAPAPAPEVAPPPPVAPAPVAAPPPPVAPAPVAAPPPPPAPSVMPPPAPAVVSPQTPPFAPSPADTRLISLEFKDADVVNLFRILAAESGRNIVMGDDVKGKMSISLRNVPWSLALDTILEARGLQRLDRDGVIRIVSVEQLTKEREARARVEEAKLKAEAEIRTKSAEADLKEQEVQGRKRALEAATAEAIARGPLTEAAIRLSYADAGDVANTLQGLLGLGTTEIRPCREEVAGFKTTQGTARTVRLGTGGGATSGPIAEPPFSQLFGPPPIEVQPPAQAPRSEDVSARTKSVRAYCAQNMLFVRLYAAELERVRRLIRDSLDLPSAQVKIEARMEILDRDDLFVIGVQWGGGGVLAVDGNKNAIVGRGFTSDPINNPVGGGIPAAGVGSLSNPNLQLGGPSGTVIPVSAQNGLPQGGNLVNLPISALLNNAAALGGAGGIAFGIIGSKINLNLTLEALRTQGKTFSLARPDIVTVENKQARISLGEEIPFATVSSAGTQIAFKDALLQLVVTPSVIRDTTRNKIKMTVVVENNARGATVNLGTSGAPPAIQTRRAETEVVVGDGDHLVIGGITTSVQQDEVRKVPTLGDIPIFGWLFKQRGTQGNRRELVVFITPSVLRTDTRPVTPASQAIPAPPQTPAK